MCYCLEALTEAQLQQLCRMKITINWTISFVAWRKRTTVTYVWSETSFSETLTGILGRPLITKRVKSPHLLIQLKLESSSAHAPTNTSAWKWQPISSRSSFYWRSNAENREKLIMTLSHLSFTHTWTIWNQQRDLSLIERTGAMTNELEEIRWKEEYLRSGQNKTVEELRRTLKPKLVDLRNRFVPKTKVSNKSKWRENGCVPISKSSQEAIRNKKTHSHWVSAKTRSNAENAHKAFTKARNKVKTTPRFSGRRLTANWRQLIARSVLPPSSHMNLRVSNHHLARELLQVSSTYSYLLQRIWCIRELSTWAYANRAALTKYTRAFYSNWLVNFRNLLRFF